MPASRVADLDHAPKFPACPKAAPNAVRPPAVANPAAGKALPPAESHRIPLAKPTGLSQLSSSTEPQRTPYQTARQALLIVLFNAALTVIVVVGAARPERQATLHRAIGQGNQACRVDPYTDKPGGADRTGTEAGGGTQAFDSSNRIPARRMDGRGGRCRATAPHFVGRPPGGAARVAWNIWGTPITC